MNKQELSLIGKILCLSLSVSAGCIGSEGELFGYPSEECRGFLAELNNTSDTDADEGLYGIFADYVEDAGDLDRVTLIRTDLELLSYTGRNSNFYFYAPYAQPGNSPELQFDPKRRSLITRRAQLIGNNQSRWVPNEVRTPYFEIGLLREVDLSHKPRAEVTAESIYKLLQENPTIRFVVLEHQEFHLSLVRVALMRMAPRLTLDRGFQTAGEGGPDGVHMRAWRNSKTLSIGLSCRAYAGIASGVLFGIYDVSGKLLRVVEVPDGERTAHTSTEGLPEEIEIRLVGG